MQRGFPEPIRYQMFGVRAFYDHCLFVLSFVLVGLVQYLIYLLINVYTLRYIYENSFLEFV